MTKQTLINNIKRTMTSKKIPTNIEEYYREDEWNSCCRFVLEERKNEM